MEKLHAYSTIGRSKTCEEQSCLVSLSCSSLVGVYKNKRRNEITRTMAKTNRDLHQYQAQRPRQDEVAKERKNGAEKCRNARLETKQTKITQAG
jgi:hypothetical protein